MVYAFLVSDSHAETVRIRIGCQDQVGSGLFRKLKSEGKCLFRLRVRIGYGREITVRLLLLRNDRDVLESQLFQNSEGRDQSGSVKRSVDDLQILRLLADRFRVKDVLLQLGDVIRVDLFTDLHIETLVDRFLLIHGLAGGILGDRLDLSHDAAVMGRRDLRAVFPVHLVSVVFGRIVAGCDVDAGNASQMTDRIGQLRRGAECVKYISLDAVCGKRERGAFGELIMHAAGIVRDRHTLLLGTDLQDVIRKALRRLTDDIDIHAVGSRSDNAAKTCRAELKIHVETLFDLIFIISDRLQLSLRFLVKIRIGQPLFVPCSVIFHNSRLLFYIGYMGCIVCVSALVA